MRKLPSVIKNLKNKINLKNLGIFFGIFVVLFALFTFVSPALAAPNDSTSSQIFDAILRVCTAMAISLATLCIKLSIFALEYIITIAGYNGYLDTPAVQVGWVMVRDVSNMFFVVVLLIIAFGTILGLEQYEWKKMMVKFVLAAILINFSRTICGVIIDAAQVFMVTFVNAVAATAGGNLMRMFKMDQIISFSRSIDSQSVNDTNVFLAAAGSLLFAAILLGVMVAYLIILLMRMLVLWVLIILSPLAFILSLLPQTQGQAQRWWKEFGNHVTVGPVVIFFVWLSFVAAGSGNLFESDVNTRTVAQMNTTVLSTETDAVGKPSSAGLSQILEWSSMANFFIAVGMLMVGVRVANELGVEGGSAFNKAVDFGKKVATIGTGVAAGMWAVNKTKDLGISGAKLAGKGLAVGAGFAVGYDEKKERLQNWFKMQAESYKAWRDFDGITPKRVQKHVLKDKTKEDNEDNWAKDEKGKYIMEDKLDKDGKTIFERDEKGNLVYDYQKDENGNKIPVQVERSWLQRQAYKRQQALVANRKRLEKTENFAKNRGELMDKRTKGVPSGIFQRTDENIDALDRIEQGMLAGEKARSAAKTEEFQSLGKNLVMSNVRFQEGKFQAGKPSILQQEAAHLMRAETTKEQLAKDQIEARKQFIKGEKRGGYTFGDKKVTGEMVVAGKVKLEEEKKALTDEVATMTEESRRGLLLANTGLNRSVTAAATAKERAEAEVKNARGGEQRKYEQSGEGLEERARIEAAKIRGERHEARMKQFGYEGQRTAIEKIEDIKGAVREKIEAGKEGKLTEEWRKRLEAEEEHKYEESEIGGMISLATIEQEEKKKLAELKVHAHEEDERKKFFAKEKKAAEDKAKDGLEGSKVGLDLKNAKDQEAAAKQGNTAFQTAQKKHDDALDARQAQLDKVKEAEAEEARAYEVGDNDRFEEAGKKRKAEEELLVQKNKEYQAAAAELQDIKNTSGLTRAEETTVAAQDVYDKELQKVVANAPTILMQQQAAELGQEAAKGFIDKMKKENLSNIFTQAAKKLKDVFDDLKASGGIDEVRVMEKIKGHGATEMASQAMYAQQLNDYYGDLSGIDKTKAVDAADDLVSVEKLGFVKQSTAFKQAMSKNTDNLQGVEREQSVTMLTKSIKDLFYRKQNGGQLDTMQQASLMSGLKYLIQNGWNDDLLGSLVDTVRKDDENRSYKDNPNSTEARQAAALKDVLINQLGIGRIGTDGRVEIVNRSGSDRTNGINRLIAMAGDNKLLMQENAVLKYQRAAKEQGRSINYEQALRDMISGTEKMSSEDLEKHRGVKVDEQANDEAEKIGISSTDYRAREAQQHGIDKNFAGITYEELKSFKDGFSSGKFGGDVEKAFKGFIEQIDKYSSQFEAFAGWKDLGLNTTHVDDVGHMKFDMDTGFAHGQLADDAMGLVLSDWRKIPPRQRISKLKSHAIGKMSEDYNTLSNFNRNSYRETFNGANTELQYSDMDGRNVNQIVKLAADEKEHKDESGRFQALHAESVLVAKQFGGDMDAAVQDAARDWQVALEEGPIALMSCLARKGGVNWENMASGQMKISLPDLDEHGKAKRDANGNLVEAKKIDRIEQLVEWINKARSSFNGQGRKEINAETIKSALSVAKRTTKDAKDTAPLEDDQPSA